MTKFNIFFHLFMVLLTIFILKIYFPHIYFIYLFALSDIWDAIWRFITGSGWW